MFTQSPTKQSDLKLHQNLLDHAMSSYSWAFHSRTIQMESLADIQEHYMSLIEQNRVDKKFPQKTKKHNVGKKGSIVKSHTGNWSIPKELEKGEKVPEIQIDQD